MGSVDSTQTAYIVSYCHVLANSLATILLFWLLKSYLIHAFSYSEIQYITHTHTHDHILCLITSLLLQRQNNGHVSNSTLLTFTPLRVQWNWTCFYRLLLKLLEIVSCKCIGVWDVLDCLQPSVCWLLITCTLILIAMEISVRMTYQYININMILY